METCFYKNYGTKWAFSFKVEPIVPRSEFRAEQFSSLCAIWELLFLKMCSLLVTLKRALVETEQNGSSLLTRKPTIPSSKSRAE